MFLRRIDDQTQQGASGTISLNAGGFKQPQLLVDSITLRLTISGTGTGASWNPSSFVNSSLLQSFYRVGEQGAAKEHVRNVPLRFLGAHATTVFDSSLDSTDNEIATAYTTNVGATTLEIYIRVPYSLVTSLKTGDDMAIRGDEIGQWLLTYGGNTDTALTITSIRARMIARCRPTRSARWCGLRSVIEYQSSKSPSTTDQVRLEGKKLAYLHFINTGSQNNNLVTFPRIDIDGLQTVDGQNLDSIVDIPRARGENFYPQLTSQAAYTSSTWVPLEVPFPNQKTSELMGGEAINLTFGANGITAGQGFYVMHSIYPQTEADLVQRGLSPDAASAAVSNAAKAVPESVLPWLPYE